MLQILKIKMNASLMKVWSVDVHDDKFIVKGLFIMNWHNILIINTTVLI